MSSKEVDGMVDAAPPNAVRSHKEVGRLWSVVMLCEGIDGAVDTAPPRAVRSRERARRLWSVIVLCEDVDGFVKVSVKLTRCGRSPAAGRVNSVSYMISFAC